MKQDRSDTARPPSDLLNGASLFLDFDGTLVEIASRPEAVVVGEELRSLLIRLRDRLDGRLAIITGRPLGDIDRLIHPLQLPVAGSHGLEHRHANGETVAADRPERLDFALTELRRVESANPGVLVEPKPLGVAVHFRGAPEAEGEVRQSAEEIAEASGLQLQPGKMVIELRAAGGNKAAGLRALMGAPPFAGTRPVFIGDDCTDEPGFAEARRLGGDGIYVGEPRETEAGFRLGSVADVLSWLDEAMGPDE